MAISAKQVIDLAKGELGYEEKKSNSQLDQKHANTGKNNFTKYEKDVFGSSGNYWCASFISWLFWMVCGKSVAAAKQVIYAVSMACETIRQAFIKAGRYSSTPKVGSLIFFSGTRHSGANHIGLVIEVTDTTVKTIEGNTSSKEFDDNGGAVAEKTYSRTYSRILGYGHPNYEGSGSNGDSSVLKQGSKGEAVKELQKNLNTIMKSGLVVDGSFGPKTVSAVESFQKKYGLTVDGVFGPKSAAKMKEVLNAKQSVKIATPTIKNGSKGENVKTLQNNLNSVINAGLTVDGSCGSKTVAAIKAFQKKYKLTVDGSYGPKSAAKMKEILG